MVPIAWKVSRVGQICLQMKKLIFWKIEYPWLGRALSTLSFRTLDLWYTVQLWCTVQLWYMVHFKGAKWECRQEAPKIKKYVIGLSYGEFYSGSFELFSKIFHRPDPDIFEFEIPTAVILLNGTSKKKIVRFWRKWYQPPGKYQEWGKSVFRSKIWFFWKIEYPWLGRALSTLSFRTLDTVSYTHLTLPTILRV